MSVAPVARRLGSQCVFCRPLVLRPRVKFQLQQNRNASNDRSHTAESNPIVDAYRRKTQKDQQEKAATAPPPQIAPQTGDIGSSSIFSSVPDASPLYTGEASSGVSDEDARKGLVKIGGERRDPENIRRLLDVNPRARMQYERRKVIQMMRKGGRLNKKEIITRTEREHLNKSHMLKTSVKKLGMLARQIQGKTIDDAITQMRFSKKKVAGEVLTQLERARDEAIVMRGMGLGGTPEAASQSGGTEGSTGIVATGTKPEPIEIQLKNGARHQISDRSQIYIDQAWVGRGTFGKLPDYRARGRMYVLRTPWTSISVVLKEEHTRVREHKEREEKRRRKLVEKVWTHLPDRPVQWQRQWYTF